MAGHPATWPPGMSIRDLVTDTLAPIPFPPGVTSGWIEAISSDGDAILYESGATLYVYEQATGMTTDVLPNAYGGNLSPDGRYALYLAGNSALMMHDRLTGVDVQLAPYSNGPATMSQDNRYVTFGQSLLDRSTGNVTRYKDCAGPLTISGDGRYIAYTIFDPHYGDYPESNYCRIIDRATGRANGSRFQDAHELHFTHDGRYLLLDNYMFPSLYDRDAPGRGGAMDLGIGHGLPSISDDGQKIAYTQWVHDWTYQSYLLLR